MKKLATWKFAGNQYFAIYSRYDTYFIVDAQGRYYGACRDYVEFRKTQAKGGMLDSIGELKHFDISTAAKGG